VNISRPQSGALSSQHRIMASYDEAVVHSKNIVGPFLNFKVDFFVD
jgi:hypothetical protein